MKGRRGLIGGLLVIGLVAAACQKSGPVPESTMSAASISEVDDAEVSTLTGVPVKVLKTDSIGYSTINRFYWIRVQGRPGQAKLLEISKAVLDEVIAAKPKAYHSFTMHFVSSEDMAPGVETQKCFAKTTFLPEGDWQKVGRTPIDGYGNYKLVCVLAEQR